MVDMVNVKTFVNVCKRSQKHTCRRRVEVFSNLKVSFTRTRSFNQNLISTSLKNDGKLKRLNQHRMSHNGTQIGNLHKIIIRVY